MLLVALALLPLLTPLFTHPVLDAAGSADWLGMSQDQVHSISDQAVGELLAGPGTFEFAGPDGRPVFEPDERRHLGDARALLLAFLSLAALSGAWLAVVLARTLPSGRALVLRTIALAGGITACLTLVLGVLASVAFESLFELFHRLAFPGGNWAFDPNARRLVQLYPTRFWELSAGTLGALVVVLGFGTWWVVGRLARRSA